jgi:general secretion pathway protein C
MIWKQNLFNIAEEKAPVLKKKKVQKELPLASKDLGLKLVGTVVSDDPSLNRALIVNLIARTQGIYKEGNLINQTLIKKVLSDRIIINFGTGDKILKMRDPFSIATRMQEGYNSASQPVNIRNRKGTRHRSITLSRELVESALFDIKRALENVDVTSGVLFNRSTGFRITSIEPDTIYSQLGLRNRDIVLSVNGQKLIGPNQAENFFQEIRAGGSLDIKVRRRARTRHIHLTIE